MPYIHQQARKKLSTAGLIPLSPGELNYVITRLLVEYLPYKPSYADFNEVLGVLEACKLEFYRRAVAEYENEKAAENGDVYERNTDA